MLALPLLALASPARAEETVFSVRPGPDEPEQRIFSSVADALEAAPAGATLRVAAGYYAERLILSRPVTLEAEPGAVVVIEHTTELPYEASLQIESAGVTIRGLTLRHASPSIAANYCLLVKSGGELLLERCTVSSDTGSGLGVEGGVVTARGCSFTGCRRHGVALYGDLMGGSAGTSRLNDCVLSGNREHGALLRDGADAALENCVVASNGDVGVLAVDSSLVLLGCQLRANKRGSLTVERSRALDAEATVFEVQPVMA